jgi:hypothetical protein
MDCSLAMAMMGLQWQLTMMSADSLHSVAAMMRDHLCWLHLYVSKKVEEMRDKEEYAGGEWCKILRSSKLLEVSDTDRG